VLSGRVFVNTVVERNAPEKNVKTGRLVATAAVLESQRFFSDSKRQMFESSVLKMSTNWHVPPFLFFGNLIWTTAELSEVKLTQSQVKVSVQKLFSF
jgi:hypothetical protein